ncbi:hypothetical protein [Paenibacillus gallinarum]|uniref:Uncharacterized protein n=1 Tax=Paenibacillus gallinarum TaxID=2762232 RepID=A0ABR8T3N1_9BACL|nr:hypothetical protein [Paenibacillus gallinarum]MBD7970358.1 hypothetical protein [Paenibacillus gallinarum]
MKKSSLWIYAVLLFVLSFDIWTNNSPQAEGFYTVILRWLDNIKISVVWSVLIFAGFLIWHKDRVHLKEQEKDELKDQMRSRMEMLVMANQQLSEYRMRDLLVDLFRRFVSTQPYVLGVQLYEYSIVNKSGFGTVKLNFIDGYVGETTDINAAQQLYYSYKMRMMREYQDALRSLYEQDDTEEINANKLINFTKKYAGPLKRKAKRDFTEEDAVTYAFASLGIDILEAALETDIKFIPPDRVAQLQSKKRIGFLQSILADSPYTFSHHGANGKANRQYIASPFHDHDRQYLYVIVLDEEILFDSEYHDILRDIADRFDSQLQKCFETVYNGNQKGDDNDGT